MPFKKVNLDAMIQRADLTTTPQLGQQASATAIPISELKLGRLHFNLLRKPLFQRATDDWDVDNIVTLIKSFRDGMLIPSVITWRSETGYTFVIDGAHRLSALIAWVNDDYGDSGISRPFFGQKILAQQQQAATECRNRIAVEVGTYNDLSNALNDSNPTPERIRWSANIALPLTGQSVIGDADTAEESFLAINQRSVQIDATEKYMIVARKHPNVIAARALVRSATGHEYWSQFTSEVKIEISKKAKAIYNIIFEPENEDIGRSIELPVAGGAYSADSIRIAVEMVNFSNSYRPSKEIDPEHNDLDGTATIRFLEKTLGIIKHISGSQPASLGLHPAVYFWSSTGKHNPAAFLAMVAFIRELIAKDQLILFCSIRAYLEEFLVNNTEVTKEILGRFGGWTKSAPAMLRYYDAIMKAYLNTSSDDEVLAIIMADHTLIGKAAVEDAEVVANRKVSRETKNAVRRRELLTSALRCPICHARLSSTTFSDDHILRAEDGGRGVVTNIQLTHPYCNHGVKESLNSKGFDAIPFPDFLKKSSAPSRPTQPSP
jgi:Protein of unknown function DUF262